MRRKNTFIKELEPSISLHRCPKTGLAWVEDGKAGVAHSAHPNIHHTGSVRGMKRLGYWNKADRTVRCRGFIYNVDHVAVTDQYDQVAAEHCQCGGKH